MPTLQVDDGVVDAPASDRPPSYPALRAVFSTAHAAMARSPAVSRRYLQAVGAVLRTVPAFPLKAHFINNLATTAWPAGLQFGSRRIDVCDGASIRLIPHSGEFDFAALIKRRLDYEPWVFQALRDRFHTFDCVVEIGANVGVYTVFFAQQAAAAGRSIPIYAFEPSRRAYARLMENLQVNGATRVTPFNVAVAERAGFSEFFEPSGRLTNGSLYREFAQHFAADVRNTLVPTVGCAEIRSLVGPAKSVLVKLDVEGAEPLVLRSLRGLIEDVRPEIVVEVLAPQDEALNALDFLRDTYTLYLLRPEGLAPRPAFRADALHRDYLLVPKER
jgi:FkbM family methyltransferase